LIETRLNRFLTFRLDRLLHTSMAKASKAYQELVGLNIRELRVIRTIGEAPGISAKALSDATFIEQTLLSKMLRKLIAGGLVRREIESRDARSVALSLTEAGLIVRQRAQALGDQLERDFLSVLSPQEQEILEACVDKLTNWGVEK